MEMGASRLREGVEVFDYLVLGGLLCVLVANTPFYVSHAIQTFL